MALLKKLVLHLKNIEIWTNAHFEKGFAWGDTGTHESLFMSGQFVRTIESMQGIKIACLEEIALDKKWISPEEVIRLLEKITNPSYGVYSKHPN